MFQGEWYILLDCSTHIGTIATTGNPYSKTLLSQLYCADVDFYLVTKIQCSMLQGEWYNSVLTQAQGFHIRSILRATFLLDLKTLYADLLYRF
jgi:hypothetical protein